MLVRGGGSSGGRPATPFPPESPFSPSPDLANLRAHHRLTSLAGEGPLELGQVGDHALDAIAAGRMRVGDGADAEILVAVVLAGPLCESDEEPLVRREAVHRPGRAAGDRLAPGDVGGPRAAEIGPVFAPGQRV